MKNLNYYYKVIISKLICPSISFLPDDLYLKIRYCFEMGRRLNLKNPRTFNEKLNWLKLYNRKPEYTSMVDKYSVKEYVARKIGNEYIIPTLGVWENPEDINWDDLPNKFVLKTTHGGGGCGVVICEDKSLFDKKIAIKRLRESLKSDIYRDYREWPYKNVKKQIIAEEFLSPSSNHDRNNSYEIKDYKFFCFNGKVHFFKVDFDRFIEHRANYYTTAGELLEIGECVCPPNFKHKEILPYNLEKMVQLAECLSENLPFIRVDLYNVKGAIYFGELTFFPAGGMGKFTEDIWDLKIGELLTLPKI